MMVKYGVLRLMGLSGKVLVIDELHAYDAYMSQILHRLLQWCKELEIPVVLLSATLPPAKKAAVAFGLHHGDPAGSISGSNRRHSIWKTARTANYIECNAAQICPILHNAEKIAEMAGKLTAQVNRMVDYHTVTGNPLRNAEGKPRSTGNTIISRREYQQDASFFVIVAA